MSNQTLIEKSPVKRLDSKPVVHNLHPPQWERDNEYHTAYPNRWAFIRYKYLRDFACEFLGK